MKLGLVAMLLLACVGYVSYFATLPLQLGCKLSFLMLDKDKEHLTQIRVPANEIQPGQDEIWVNGRLYDIAKTEISDGIATLTVFHDTSEENVVHIQNQLIDGSVSFACTSHSQVSAPVHLHMDDRVLTGRLTPEISVRLTTVFKPGSGQFSYQLDKGYSHQFAPPPRANVAQF